MEDGKEREEESKMKDTATLDNRHVFLKDNEDEEEDDVADFDIPDDPNPFE